jgi:glycine oxidase
MAATIGNPPDPDVIIIGGGVIGCAAALRLAQARLSVAVLERGDFGGEASTAAAGMIAPQGEMVEFGHFFELCAASRDLYPEFVAELEDLNGQKTGGRSLGYRRDGILMLAAGESESSELERIYQSQVQHGLALERLNADEVHLRAAGLSPQVRWGVLVPGDHWIDNERLTPALVEAGRKLGVTYLAHTAVRKLNLGRGRVANIEVSQDRRPVTTHSAGCFILAAGCWSGELVAPLGIRLPVEPCRGQMIEFESSAEFPLVLRQGHHYLVPRAPHRILAGTTAEYVGHERAVTGEGLASILRGVERFAPFVKGLKFRRAWAGLRPDTKDHLPIIGRGELENLVFATGHFRNGILLAPITAQLVAELVTTGYTSRPIESYRPARFS